MIAVKLMGGLGNQMFQYAAALKLADLHNTTVVLDISWFNNRAEIDTPRFFELDQCNVQANNISNGVRTVRDTNRVFRKLEHLALRRPGLYSQSGSNFDPSFFKLPDNILLQGYFQSEQYFSSIRPQLLKQFTPSYQINDEMTQHLKLIKKSTNSVSLHVRRGDYVSNKHANSYHGLAGLSYYKAAIKKVESAVHKKLTIFVFSDDLDWCRANLKFTHDVHFVDGAQKSFDDLWLMSHCHHNIIANSSYSWWGAWLNQNKSKIIVAPKQWVQDSSVNTADLVPEEWIRL